MNIHPEIGFRSNPFSDHMANIKNWARDLSLEITLYTDRMRDAWSSEIWWDYHESTLLGLMVTGMARNPLNKDLVMLQEFAVKDIAGKGNKRADLYVQNGNVGYLVEAKYLNDPPRPDHFDDKGLEEFFEKDLSQVRGYYSLEQDWYTHLKRVVLVVIYFHPLGFKDGSVTKNEHIESAISYQPTLYNSFYTLIDPVPGKESTVLEIYGRIEEVNTQLEA